MQNLVAPKIEMCEINLHHNRYYVFDINLLQTLSPPHPISVFTLCNAYLHLFSCALVHYTQRHTQHTTQRLELFKRKRNLQHLKCHFAKLNLKLLAVYAVRLKVSVHAQHDDGTLVPEFIQRSTHFMWKQL